MLRVSDFTIQSYPPRDQRFETVQGVTTEDLDDAFLEAIEAAGRQGEDVGAAGGHAPRGATPFPAHPSVPRRACVPRALLARCSPSARRHCVRRQKASVRILRRSRTCP